MIMLMLAVVTIMMNVHEVVDSQFVLGVLQDFK